MFFWKSGKLIGSLTVFYLLIDNSSVRVALLAVNFIEFCLKSAQYCRFWTAIF